MSGRASLWTGLHAATMDPERGGAYGAIEDAAIVLDGETIAWLGPSSALPPEYRSLPETQAGGRWVTPGLIDCHTHLVWGGSRAEEFELRLTGVPYDEIARRGGGILSTVRATREASEEQLFHGARRRLDRLRSEGVTGIEIKSGYGLDRDTELRMLRVARRLGDTSAVDVSTTYLGAHTVPPEADGDSYMDWVCAEMLPEVASTGAADAVDVFCEGIGFSRAQSERLFDAASANGLPLKAHVEQLSNLGGAELAARYGALSVDHLEYLDQDGVEAVAAAGTVAVLLPGAFYFLRETRRPPVEALFAAGVPVAIASDCNPGSSPATSLLLMMNMACTLFGLDPAQALAGVTREAARALGWQGRRGMLRVGMQADLAFWDIERPAELSYGIGHNPCSTVIHRGTPVTGLGA